MISYQRFSALPKLLKLTKVELEQALVEKENIINTTKALLEESEKKYHALLFNNPAIVTKLDKDLNILYMNDTIARNIQLPKSPYVSNSMYDIGYPKEEIELLHAKVKESLKNKKIIVYESKSEVTNKYFETTISPLFQPDDKDYVVAISKDITFQKNIEIELHAKIKLLEKTSAELEVKNQFLEQFTDIFTHNLRSPIINLNSLYDIYIKSTESEERDFILLKFKDVLETLSKTIKELNHVGTIRRNISVKKTVLDFEAQLKIVTNTLSGQILEKNAQIEYDFQAAPTIEYPKIYLESIFLNLLSNALKYSSNDRAPHILLKSFFGANKKIALTCEDNGMGIDMSKHGHKIFGLYKTFHHHPEANGVGLFITKNQVEAMGGSISVDSQVDRGTKFTIYF
jgi:PAS domain S-box-containing protein